MRKFLASVALATSVGGAALLSFAPAANANTYWNFDGQFSGGVTLFATLEVDNTNQIVGITGALTGLSLSKDLAGPPATTIYFPSTLTITGLNPSGQIGGGTNVLPIDNSFNPGGPIWIAGTCCSLSFTLSPSTSQLLGAGIWQNSPTDYEIFIGNWLINGDLHGSVQISQTPLPSTWTMLIASFVGFGFLAYRGTKKSTALAAA